MLYAKRIGQRDPLNHWGEWWLDAVLNRLAHQALDDIKPVNRNSQHLTSLVIDAEQQGAACSAVSKGCKLISQVVLRGTSH